MLTKAFTDLSISNRICSVLLIVPTSASNTHRQSKKRMESKGRRKRTAQMKRKDEKEKGERLDLAMDGDPRTVNEGESSGTLDLVTSVLDTGVSQTTVVRNL